MTSCTPTKRPDLTDLFEYKPEVDGVKCVPIVYDSHYDISFWKLQCCHPFDTEKWGKIHAFLVQHFEKKLKGKKVRTVRSVSFISPLRPISDDELSVVHSEKFMKDIHTSTTIAYATEVFFLALIPSSILNRKLLVPLKWQTAGSVLAASRALHCKWAINLGGGFHHCSAKKAEGFCLFADITLIMKILWKTVSDRLHFMIVDLDAHQGNGYARDVSDLATYEKRTQVYIMDVYNSHIYPNDIYAKAIINKSVELVPHVKDDYYLDKVKIKLREALLEFKPELIIYNAGTDVLIGDPLGRLDITANGIIARDEIVFREAKERSIPIVMLTSGGYQRSNAEIIAKSIINLHQKKLIDFDRIT